MLPAPFLNADRLLAETFLADIRLFGELRSTNDYAIAAAREEVATPLLIAAESQTAGRGRGGNRWMSGSGALTFSLVVEPERHGIPRARWPILSLAVGASVCAALGAILQGRGDVRLKWPNDVYIDGRKVCGILVESPAGAPSRLVIGTGINVCNRRQDAAPEIRDRMTSLADAIGEGASELNRTDVLIVVVQQLAAHFDRLAIDPELVIERCRAACYLTGRLLSVNDGQRMVSGSCQGIDDDGALRIATEDGPQRCMAGTVELLD
jgi:BirA family biotin operon repressor/biotin-[acetyl-CoA-carboxylase] ligase